MARVIKGEVTGSGRRFAIAVSRTNELVTTRLLEGCLDELARHGVAPDDVTVAWVPGSFELPLVARRLAETGEHAAVICLGAVLRGETPHFDYVAGEAAKGVSAAAAATGIPVAFGVLTCDNLEQALQRAGGKGGHKGREAAVSALEMANVLAQIGAPASSGATEARARAPSPLLTSRRAR